MSQFTMELDYLIIYTNSGTPIYARCFSDICKTAIGDPVLFSAFLASLNQFAKIDPQNMPKDLNLNGIPISIELDTTTGISHINMEELDLMFYYTELDDIIIATGFNSKRYDRNIAMPVFSEFTEKIEVYLEGFTSTTWNNISKKDLLNFEIGLLHEIVYPFFDFHDIKDTCGLGGMCPFRVAIFDEKSDTIFQRLQSKIEQYRNFNFFQKIKTLVKGYSFPLPFSIS